MPDFVAENKKLAGKHGVFVNIVAKVTTVLMFDIVVYRCSWYNYTVKTGLISFDVGTFTSYASRPEANVRFQKLA